MNHDPAVRPVVVRHVLDRRSTGASVADVFMVDEVVDGQDVDGAHASAPQMCPTEGFDTPPPDTRKPGLSGSGHTSVTLTMASQAPNATQVKHYAPSVSMSLRAAASLNRPCRACQRDRHHVAGSTRCVSSSLHTRSGSTPTPGRVTT